MSAGGVSGRPPMGAGPRAAVDVGTNSVRLLVVGEDGMPLRREMEITRLGQGVDERGHLDDGALDRTLATLRRYRSLWEDAGATAVRIAATSAVRDASDRGRFFAGVRAVTGVDAEVLSGEDEAATAFLGAARAVGVARPCALLDVGGGSTELIVGDERDEVAASVSLQLGCVRLTERVLHRDPPTTAELEEAAREVGRQLDRADEALGRAGAAVADAATLVGVAGTVTTLAALHLDLPGYLPEAIHATEVPATAVRELVQRLAALPASARRELGPMAPGREDVIVAGALIVREVVDRYGFGAIVASEADMLDGLVARA